MSTTYSAEETGATLSQRRVIQIIIGTVVAGFFALAVVAGGAGWLLLRAQEYGDAVRHTYDVEARISDFRTLYERSESARRGYLISALPRFEQTYEASTPELKPLLAELRGLVADNPEQTARLDIIQPLLDEKLDLLAQSMALRRQGDLMAAVTAFQDPREQALLDRIRAVSAEMAVAEQALLDVRTRQQTANARLLFVAVSLAAIMLGAMALASLAVMRRFARDLLRSQGRLQRLNEGLEAAVRARTADLTRANEEIQRFAYIVSHDLRSPLVNIMGFTSELEAAAKPLRRLLNEAEAAAPDAVTPEARAAVEVDLPESIDFIRSSTRKMDRLINAILKLSREGRRSLNPERLSMSAMLEGIADSLTVLADQKGAEVILEGPFPDIVSDRLAIEQVFSNLIENGLKYLKPDRPGRVRVRGRVEGERVIYEVEDNGRGVDPKDHERIFDLFRRAGSQDQPGEGIGLAHVRALIYRLGGLISCASELDQGATFRISLPRELKVPAGRDA